MGTWGSGPFENDDAADFNADLAGTDPADRILLLRRALQQAADNTGYLEIDDAQTAVAAAAIVAAWTAGQAVDDASDLTNVNPIAVTPDLIASACRALDRVVGPDAEWRSLWGAGAEATDEVATIRSALPDG